MQFDMTNNEFHKLNEFLDEHNKTCQYYDDGSKVVSPEGAIGGRLTYCFTPTGLGNAVVVKCACGTSLDLTDYKSW